jgi:hypothetical protein
VTVTSGTDLPVLPAAVARFKPTRAGVINLWDYDDEEFVFADGRLALKGHNGSGKTKALEVLFPFVLDGQLDPRRLDPFSGEDRTMKSNLLYRGQESEVGYVWMEFARHREDGSIDAVTIGAGLRAQRSRTDVPRWYFVTDGRVGADFGLLTRQARPLTRRQLSASLGEDHLFRSATEYRAAVDTRLFGLGRERYGQMVDMLLRLRKPLLAKDLDPIELSKALTSGLRPVEDDLVAQAARDFDNLTEIQTLLEGLQAADGAVTGFLQDYTRYLGTRARAAIDEARQRITATAGECELIATAAGERASATESLQAAEEELRGLAAKQTALTQRLQVLLASVAYQQQGAIDQLRARTRDAEKAVSGHRARIAEDRKELACLLGEAEDRGRTVESLRAGLQRTAAGLLEDAEAAGIRLEDDPVSWGERLVETVAALAVGRFDDVEAVRALLARVSEAQQQQRSAEDGFRRAGDELKGAETSLAEQQDRLDRARARARQELSEWAARWADPDAGSRLPPGTVPALEAALERADQAGAAPLSVTFRAQVGALHEALVTERSVTDGARRDLSQRIDRLRGLRAEIAAERDDAPADNDLRTADRRERAGAPFWRLVRFHDDVPPEEAGAVEGALYGANLLTAWVHPNGELTQAGLRAGEIDGYLLPLPPAARPRGATLSDVLVAEEQELVPAERIEALLASISLSSTQGLLTSTTVPAPPAGPRAPDGVPAPPAGPRAPDGVPAPPAGPRAPDGEPGLPPGTVVVTGEGRFALGVQVGAHPKATPEFIGATARAQRRAARLAALDHEVGDRARALAGLEVALADVEQAMADLRTAEEELPPITTIAAAEKQCVRAAATLDAARTRQDHQRRVRDRWIAEVEVRRRRLRQGAAERAMPVEAAAVEHLARAVETFERSGQALAHARDRFAQAELDLADRRRLLEGRRSRFADDVESQTEREENYLKLVAELDEALAAQDPEGAHVLSDKAHLEQELAAADEARKRAENQTHTQRDRLSRSDQQLADTRRRLSAVLTAQFTAAAGLGPIARPDLCELLGVRVDVPWPPLGTWPAADDLAAEIFDRLVRPPLTAEPADEARSALPRGVLAHLDALHAKVAATPVTDSARRGWDTRAMNAAETLSTRLDETGQDYRLERDLDEGLLVVRVADADGLSPIGRFAAHLKEHIEDQSLLLEARERTLLEDALLKQLAQQIHARTRDARDLVSTMDADTRSRPMSSGTAVGIRWVTADKITDSQKAVAGLLAKAPEYLGPDGLDELRRLLREQLHTARARETLKTYHQVLAEVLDYRAWHAFELRLVRPGMPEEKLTKAKHSVLSGGEKSSAIHLPLFAAANAQYSSARPTCPRMIALDEAFAGIDAKYRPDLLELTVKFDLDLFMTGHDLWVTYPCIPQIAHYDLHHDKIAHTVSAMLLLWDGTQILDDVTFPSSEDLAAAVLGITPSRYSPDDLETPTLDDPDTTEDDEE